jgi:hypothetical protein
MYRNVVMCRLNAKANLWCKQHPSFVLIGLTPIFFRVMNFHSLWSQSKKKKEQYILCVPKWKFHDAPPPMV